MKTSLFQVIQKLPFGSDVTFTSRKKRYVHMATLADSTPLKRDMSIWQH